MLLKNFQRIHNTWIRIYVSKQEITIQMIWQQLFLTPHYQRLEQTIDSKKYHSVEDKKRTLLYQFYQIILQPYQSYEDKTRRT